MKKKEKKKEENIESPLTSYKTLFLGMGCSWIINLASCFCVLNFIDPT